MKFSIVIPVYNVATYLRESLDSVLVQTHQDWECICVDDGSTDGSGAILDEYARREPFRIRVIHQRNAGVSAARNVALDSVTGERIIFLDGDDCLHSDLLSLCCDACAKESPDVVMYDQEPFEDEHGTATLRTTGMSMDISRRLPYDPAEADFFQFAYSSAVLKGLRFPQYIMGEDRLFLAWALVRARKLARLDGVGYYYRQRPGSAVNSRYTWRKWHDDLCHSMRRMGALIMCQKHVEWRIYRHQCGLWANLLKELKGVIFP